MINGRKRNRRGIGALLILGIAAIIGVTAMGVGGCKPPPASISSTTQMIINYQGSPGSPPPEISLVSGPAAPGTTTPTSIAFNADPNAPTTTPLPPNVTEGSGTSSTGN